MPLGPAQRRWRYIGNHSGRSGVRGVGGTARRTLSIARFLQTGSDVTYGGHHWSGRRFLLPKAQMYLGEALSWKAGFLLILEFFRSKWSEDSHFPPHEKITWWLLNNRPPACSGKVVFSSTFHVHSSAGAPPSMQKIRLHLFSTSLVLLSPHTAWWPQLQAYHSHPLNVDRISWSPQQELGALWPRASTMSGSGSDPSGSHQKSTCHLHPRTVWLDLISWNPPGCIWCTVTGFKCPLFSLGLLRQPTHVLVFYYYFSLPLLVPSLLWLF